MVLAWCFVVFRHIRRSINPRIQSDIRRADTYHDNLSLLEDGVVGLGKLGGLLCVDHGLVQILRVDRFRHCVGFGEVCEVCRFDLMSSTLCRGLFEWMRKLELELVAGGWLDCDLQDSRLMSLPSFGLKGRGSSLTNLRDLDLQVEDYREEKKVGYR